MIWTGDIDTHWNMALFVSIVIVLVLSNGLLKTSGQDVVCFNKLLKNRRKCEEKVAGFTGDMNSCCQQNPERGYFSEEKQVGKNPRRKKYKCVPCGEPLPGSTTTTLPPAIWTQWSDWKCDRAFIQERVKECPPNPGNCLEPSPKKNRAMKVCPHAIDGGWSTWEAWMPCTVTCGSGTRIRVRECDKPNPQHGGKHCVGSHYHQEICNPPPCSVDGKWGKWFYWTPCSKTCGPGVSSRQRVCTPPQHRGRECEGNSTQMKDCNYGRCPEWSTWQPWTDCDILRNTCGEGHRYRKRSCVQHDLMTRCPGNDNMGERCEVGCPQDGGWSEWGPVNCRFEGPQEKKKIGIKFRTCTNPRPLYGGLPCDGQTSSIEPSC